MNNVKLIECPRDAMQGWKTLIPTESKIEYLNTLLEVGFDTLDFGSFVSPKAIPQMADTVEVCKNLNTSSDTKLLAIVANTRGAQEAIEFEKISYVGFPFSISETFQQRNAHASIRESLQRVKEIQEICKNNSRKLVVYISMAFGNPYGDAYSPEIVYEWVDKIISLGVEIISLADTVGVATPMEVRNVTEKVIRDFPSIETGVHLHSTPEHWQEKVEAALNAGCHRIDGALRGVGGCPMANDELIGNLDSEKIIPFLQQKHLLGNINSEALLKASRLAMQIFKK